MANPKSNAQPLEFRLVREVFRLFGPPGPDGWVAVPRWEITQHLLWRRRKGNLDATTFRLRVEPDLVARGLLRVERLSRGDKLHFRRMSGAEITERVKAIEGAFKQLSSDYSTEGHPGYRRAEVHDSLCRLKAEMAALRDEFRELTGAALRNNAPI